MTTRRRRRRRRLRPRPQIVAATLFLGSSFNNNINTSSFNFHHFPSSSSLLLLHPFHQYHHQKRRHQCHRSSSSSSSSSRQYYQRFDINDDNHSLPPRHYHRSRRKSTTSATTTTLIYDKNNEITSSSTTSPPPLPTWLTSSYSSPTTNTDESPTTSSSSTTTALFLSRLATHLSTLPQLSPSDNRDIFRALQSASGNDDSLMTDAADFLLLLLSTEEDDNIATKDDDDDDDDDGGGGLISRETLIAAIYHYCDCVVARRRRVYDYTEQVLAGRGGEWRTTESLHPEKEEEEEGDDEIWESCYDDKTQRLQSTHEDLSSRDNNEPLSSFRTTATAAEPFIRPSSYGSDVEQITRSTYRIKRAEILSSMVSKKQRRRQQQRPITTTSSAAIIPYTPSSSSSSAYSPSTTTPFSDRRDLLLSITDDWRALAIRSTAALYRLRGILRDVDQRRRRRLRSFSRYYHPPLTPEDNAVVRDAFHIYAPLSSRLGRHRLKSALEELGFRLLYPRQYRMVVDKIYGDDTFRKMTSVADGLVGKVEELLSEDELLKGLVGAVRVESRVKQPYSLWKKCLKMKKKKIMTTSTTRNDDDNNAISKLITTTTLSTDNNNNNNIKSISDAIALRIIIKARHLSPDDSVDDIRTRERFLCYYIRELCRTKWPAAAALKMKDYIKYPKPNGYQSLHYTAKGVFMFGEYWPFELQIRSEEMHALAEYGVAAHWDYKLQSSPKPPAAATALPSRKSVKQQHQQQPIAFLPPSSSSSSDAITNITTTTSTFPSSSSSTATASTSYIDALSTARTKLAQRNVYIFILTSTSPTNDDSTTTSGKLLTLPIGSTISDVLNECHYSYQMTFRDDVFCLRNGRRTMGDTLLENGDVVTLPPLVS